MRLRFYEMRGKKPRCSSVVKHLPCMHEVWGSIFRPEDTHKQAEGPELGRSASLILWCPVLPRNSAESLTGNASPAVATGP